MSDLDDIDFFRSGAVLKDPYPYYEQLRSHCPVHREPHEGVVMVTGYDEALAVYHDVETFSSANSVTGPFPGFSTPLEGDDVTEQIEAQRDALPFSDQLPTFDPPKHTQHRGLLTRLLSPGRLRENEAAMWRLAEAVLPRDAVYDFNQALMDFGATWCTARKPLCLPCPMRRFCRAYPWETR